jgi:hypothetical protein
VDSINEQLSSEKFKRLYSSKCIGVSIEYIDELINGYQYQYINIGFMRKAFDWQDAEFTVLCTIRKILYKSDEFNAQPFIDAIAALEESDIEEKEYLTDYEFFDKLSDDQKKLIKDVESQACIYLITKNGVSYNAINELKNVSIKITPGETDSFGWLTGCVHTKKGIVVFG